MGCTGLLEHRVAVGFLKVQGKVEGGLLRSSSPDLLGNHSLGTLG